MRRPTDLDCRARRPSLCRIYTRWAVDTCREHSRGMDCTGHRVDPASHSDTCTTTHRLYISSSVNHIADDNNNNILIRQVTLGLRHFCDFLSNRYRYQVSGA